MFKFEGVAVLNPTRTQDVNHYKQGLRYVLHVETTQKPLSQALTLLVRVWLMFASLEDDCAQIFE